MRGSAGSGAWFWPLLVWLWLGVGEATSRAEGTSGGPVEPATGSSPVTVVTRLDPDPSHVGDLLAFEVLVAYPDGYTVNLPTGLDFAPLELVGIDPSDPESTGTGWRRVFLITLQFFDVGEASIGSFPITYVDSAGDVQKVAVPARTFTVERLLANEADPQPADNDAPVSPAYSNQAAEIAIYSGAAAVVLGLILAALWSRWRRRARPEVVVPPIPPHERAMSALDSLAERRQDLLETGRAQDYYVELTEIAKAYVQGRFGIETLDRTTEEIRRLVERAAQDLPGLEPGEFVKFLQSCDLVKFARLAPNDEEPELALNQVRDIVVRTAPSEPGPAPVLENEPATEKPEKEVA